MTKTPEEVELMAEAGRLLASVFTHLDGLTLAGMTTLEVNDLVEAFIVGDLRARPASKGQYGYGFVRSHAGWLWRANARNRAARNGPKPKPRFKPRFNGGIKTDPTRGSKSGL